MSDQLRPEELTRFLNDPYEEIAYEKGWVLTGLNIRAKESSWLLIVKCTRRLDGPMVAFIEAGSIILCLDYLATYIYREGVPLRWSKDKYA